MNTVTITGNIADSSSAGTTGGASRPNCRIVGFLQVGVGLMRISQKGQVTIPAEFREQLGFLPDTEVQFLVEGDALKLTKSRPTGTSNRAAKVLRRLQGSATVRMTTDEIMGLTRNR